jgi:hypothetical protein
MGFYLTKTIRFEVKKRLGPLVGDYLGFGVEVELGCDNIPVPQYVVIRHQVKDGSEAINR